MNRNKKKFKKNSEQDYIDLTSVIFAIYKDKVIVLCLMFFVGLLGYFYSKTLNEQYFSQIKVKSISHVTSPFFEYENSYKNLLITNKSVEDDRSKKSIQFANEITREVLSNSNFFSFIKNSEVTKDLRFILNKNGISINEFLRNNNLVNQLEAKKNSDELIIDFKLFYPKGVNGDEILSQYVFFISKKVFSSYFHKIESQIRQTINIIELNYEIAEKLNLVSPKFLSGSTFNQSENQYLKGTDVLAEELKKLNQVLNFILNSNANLAADNNMDVIKYSTPTFLIEWQPIIEKGFIEILPVNTSKFIFIGTILGFILATIIIFAKNIKKSFFVKKPN